MPKYRAKFDPQKMYVIMDTQRKPPKKPKDYVLLNKEYAKVFARRIMWLALDLVNHVDLYEVDSAAVENDVMTIWGLLCRFRHMSYALAKKKAMEKLVRQRAAYRRRYAQTKP